MDEKLPTVRRTFYSIYVKRALDAVLSGAALIVLSPVLAVVALLELRYHGRPVLYRASRGGKDGKVFTLYKFRSMTDERGPDGELLPSDRRLTPFGRLLRRTSLDELPSLWNVFKGDMSIVGPRPLSAAYLPLYSPRHAMRHSVRPGLACGHVVHNREEIWTWREQFENDIFYIENISLRLDIKMLYLIVREVLEGSSYRVDDTRELFTGDNLDGSGKKTDPIIGDGGVLENGENSCESVGGRAASG